jgi:hypothetical protein
METPPPDSADTAVWERARAAARSIVRMSPPSAPFDLERFVATLGAHRQRPIQLIAVDRYTAGDICGAWFCMPTRDVIAYEDATTRTRRDHIVLHEVAHMVCDHRGSMFDEDTFFEQFLPGLPKALIRSQLGRSQFDTAEEREAELVATLLVEDITARSRPARDDSATADPNATTARVESVLGTDPGERL